MTKSIASWLNEKFLDWENKQGKRQTISGFAEFLSVPQPSLSNWMAGVHEPSGESLLKIAKKLGMEIYEIAGVKNPPISDSEILEIASKWSELSEKQKEKIMQIVNGTGK